MTSRTVVLRTLATCREDTQLSVGNVRKLPTREWDVIPQLSRLVTRLPAFSVVEKAGKPGDKAVHKRIENIRTCIHASHNLTVIEYWGWVNVNQRHIITDYSFAIWMISSAYGVNKISISRSLCTVYVYLFANTDQLAKYAKMNPAGNCQRIKYCTCSLAVSAAHFPVSSCTHKKKHVRLVR